MLTGLIAAATWGGCTAARWYLDRESRKDTDHAGGRIRLKAVWNEGAAFGLNIPRKAVLGTSVVLLGVLWSRRREHPAATGLLLGGGISNLSERLGAGRVYDYVQFPRAPGGLKHYVFNLADFAILAGGIGLSGKKKNG